jgi:hypothetical protein
MVSPPGSIIPRTGVSRQGAFTAFGAVLDLAKRMDFETSVWVSEHFTKDFWLIWMVEFREVCQRISPNFNLNLRLN